MRGGLGFEFRILDDSYSIRLLLSGRAAYRGYAEEEYVKEANAVR